MDENAAKIPYSTQTPTVRFDACLMMYKANDFTEGRCERESLFKQRTAPHLLQDYDVKWLSNVDTRKKACMDLLTRKGNLGVLNSISRWLSGK
jgi:hypothetical protein